MRKSLGQRTTGNTKKHIKNGVIKAPEVVRDSWVTPNINWFPGHMLKAKKELAKQLKRVDEVLEMRDARIPVSSVNHDFEELLLQKKRILIFNKTGLADAKITKKWEAYFKKMDTPFLFVDALIKKDLQKILPLSRKLMQEKWSNFSKKGIRHPPLKLLIIGVPNVGKSSLINRLSKRKAAETGPNPGVTKHQDWIKLDKEVELLDTPGVLMPKIENRETGLRLTITGAIKDSVVGTSRLSDYLLSVLQIKAPLQIQQHYHLTPEELDLLPGDLLKKIAEKRGFMKIGGTIDYSRAECLVLRDFRAGRLGRLSFDQPENTESS